MNMYLMSALDAPSTNPHVGQADVKRLPPVLYIGRRLFRVCRKLVEGVWIDVLRVLHIGEDAVAP